MKHLAIFDMDGTIVDSRKVIQGAMHAAFTACDLAPPDYEQTRQVVGLGLHEACKRLASDACDAPTLERLVGCYRDAFIANRDDPDFKEPLYPGAVELIETLRRRGWGVAMATGKSRRGIDAIFAMHPLADLFDTIHCADDGPGKPDPFMITEALRAMEATPDQSVIIGDAVFDMQMGKAAGIAAFGVDWGFGTRNELRDAGADAVFSNFSSLGAALLDRERTNRDALT